MFKLISNTKTANKLVNFKQMSRVLLQYKQITSVPNLRNYSQQGLAQSKFVYDTENRYAYSKLPKLTGFIPKSYEEIKITTKDEFEGYLNKNWNYLKISEIVSGFKNVLNYCQMNNITFSDRHFDGLIDGLLNNCEYLTNNDLFELLQLISKFPPCESIESHNFNDLWTCLDDICCWKLSEWTINERFLFADCWYFMKMGRMSDYLFEMLDQSPSKIFKLGKSSLIRTFFYLNVIRKRKVEFEYEDHLAGILNELTIDDLSIVAMAYFKTQSKIKMTPILLAMINGIIQHSNTIHELTLTPLLKAIRLSQKIDIAPKLPLLLDKLTPEIPRFSLQCCLHIILLGTTLTVFHENSLKICCKRFIENIKEIRVKDIERLLLVTTMFNYQPEIKDFYAILMTEINKETRLAEFDTYKRCLTSSLNYLSFRGLYSEKLSNYVLTDEFLTETYGKSARLLPLDVLSLNTNLEIELPSYNGNKLLPVRKYKAVKWLTEFIPNYGQVKKLTLADKMFLDIVDHLQFIVDGNYRLDHVLPHFKHADIVLCKDTLNGFIKPFGYENYVLGDVKRPILRDNLTWYTFIVLFPNIMIRDTCLPLGSQLLKQRLLGKIGYKTCFVIWNQFMGLSKEEKVCYLRNKLEEAEK